MNTRPRTPEQKAAISAAMKKAWSDPKRKRSRVKNIRKAVRKAMKDPKTRARLIEAVKRGGKTRTTPIEVRFWKNVDKNSSTHVEHMKTSCWLWIGPKQPLSQRENAGRIYGLIGRGGKYGGSQLVHRYSFELHKGSAEGFQVQHHCDIPLCVRPSHLKLGSQQDNSDDMKKRNRPRGRYRTTAKP